MSLAKKLSKQCIEYKLVCRPNISIVFVICLAACDLPQGPRSIIMFGLSTTAFSETDGRTEKDTYLVGDRKTAVRSRKLVYGSYTTYQRLISYRYVLQAGGNHTYSCHGTGDEDSSLLNSNSPIIVQ